MRRDTARSRFAWWLRMLGDRIDPSTGPRGIGWSFTHEPGRGIVFREGNQGCPLWAMKEDYDRAHDEADTEHTVVLWENLEDGCLPKTRRGGREAMSVMGLDLSLTAPGMVADRVLGTLVSETLRTDPRRGDKRYCDIRDWLVYYAHDIPYSLAVIEAVPPYDHASSGLERVHGIAREVLARYDIPFAYVNVTALKAFATGNGRADKSEVMDYAEAETGKRPADDNQADGWVLHRMGELFLATGLDLSWLNPAQAKAMGSVEWPLLPGDTSWPQPYGTLHRKPVTKKCKHGVVCLKNGDGWLHPFTVDACDKPPKGR
jgi:Holliday junction resolvasome RuvABC endonuclease subunit